MEDKKFDAVKLVRKIRDRQEKQLAKKAHEERVAYYRQKAAEMDTRIPKLAADVSPRANQPQ